MTYALPVFGIAGYKNSGKTTLVVRLVEEFRRRGLRVATIKHAHHSFKIDDDETDSARHRRAGAAQVAIISSKRWALVSELNDRAEPALEDVVGQLARHDPPHDLVLVEGYKAEPIPKIECRRRQTLRERAISDDDPMVVAIAADLEVDDVRLPVFALDDVAGIADFVLTSVNVAGDSLTR